MVGQLIDTVCVISITYFLSKTIPIPEGKSELEGLFLLIMYAYVFKFFIALLDTPILYGAVKYLKKYLGIAEDNI
jgi:uncharacterized PurR-regulated membrane protein YhhQ (DUF165 family)